MLFKRGMILETMPRFILFCMLWSLGTQAIAVSNCIESERNALLTFKASLVDPKDRLSSWEGRNCRNWEGVVCSNTTGRVVKLNLRNSYGNPSTGPSLSGEINPSLLLLSDLVYLDLSMNNFSGLQIPAFIGSFEKLMYLNLSGASFNGMVPPQLGNLSNLRHLDLNAYNSFSYGALRVDNTRWLTHLSSLKYLDMNSVDLSTAVDWLQAVNMLPSLKVLHLSSCNLQQIPISLPHINFTNLNALDLSYNIFNSTLPTWLWNLTRMTYLDLSINNFHGFIPDALSYLRSLRVLNLESNNFRGMKSRAFGNLCNLTTLDLSMNGFGGEIKRWLELLPQCARNKLQYLYLAENKLRGNLSGPLEHMINLIELDLSTNELNGTIPIKFGMLSNLTKLSLNYNSLEGVITEAQFGYLKKLKHLFLSYNFLIVRVSHDWVPPFQLEDVRLNSCRLGPKFPAWLRGQTQLRDLELSNSGIIDNLPNSLWNTSRFLNYLDLSNNQLKGKLPVTLDQTVLWYLNLSSNLLEGPLPSLPQTLGVLDLSDNSLTGPLPIQFPPNIEGFHLSNNNIFGSMPSSLCELLPATILDLSNNKLSGEIPECIGRVQTKLLIVDLMNNNLSGGIPNSMCDARILSTLNLRNNSLSGEIPSCMQQCTSLFFLDLGHNNFSGNIPIWIGESLSYLMVLSLSSNNFFGNIPGEIVRLGYIQILDLSNNNLSGFIPPTIGNFGSSTLKEGQNADPTQQMFDMSYIYGDIISSSIVIKGEYRQYSKTLYLTWSIDLSNNNLSGDIPEEVGDLWALQNLNLSWNHLTGNIPDKIGKMQSLESLDLAMNKLSGTIPPGLSALNYLSYLNLSYNNLSGRIPSGNQLQTLDDPSIYIGNPYLCGPPTARDCSSDETNYDSNGRPKGTFEKVWLYLSVVSGFVVGFWVVCGVLLFSKSFRSTYFTFVDTMSNKLYVAFALTLNRLSRRFEKM